jgi:VWFA-related protein
MNRCPQVAPPPQEAMNYRPGSVLWCAVLCTLFATIRPGAQEPVSPGLLRPDEQPVFRSRTVVVQIDVFVTDAAGNPVEGLTAEDFEVVEAGSRRPMSSFTEVRLPIPEPRALPTDETVEPDVITNARPPGRTFVFAFDEVRPDRALRMRHVLREFLAQYFGPDDQAAVALVGRGLADSGQDFTSNRRLLLEAIDKFSGGFQDLPDTPCPVDSPDPRQLAASLRQLSEFLATLPGRKVLVLVAEGLSGLDFNLLRAYRGGVLSLENTDALAALSALTRGNVTVYPVDPCGLQVAFAQPTVVAVGSTGADIPNERLEAQADLNALAEITGGFAVTNTNNFTGAFDRLLAENSRYYTIGFTSAYDKNDGRFVPVTVRVKRPGLQVRSRAGYVAPKGEDRRPEPVKGDTRLATVAAGLASAVPTPGVGLHVAATPYRSERGASHVSVVVEMEVPRQGLTRKGEVMTAPIEVSYLATDSRGKVKPGKRHSMTLTLPAASAGGKSPEPLRVWSDFQLAPGRYQLRVAAGTRAVAGSAIADLEVPDFTKQPLAMSGVFLTADRTTAKALASASPLASVLPATPTTRREFRRDETVTGYVEVYENNADRTASEPSELSVSLRGGSGVIPLAPQTRTVPIGTSAIVHRSVVPIALKDLPGGNYVLEVQARSRRQEDLSVTRRIPLLIR